MEFENVKKILQKYNITTDTKISIAFSGGPDSVFLVHVMTSLGYKPELIYINYHDSNTVDIEEDIVNKIANMYNLHLTKVDVDISYAKNFEDEARKVRYNFFEKFNKLNNIEYLLTAHQYDDYIETFIIQKERGGVVTYYGIKELVSFDDLKILRPLLSYSKFDIISYLERNYIPFYDDPTNLNQKRKRNRIRMTYDHSSHDFIYQEIQKENDRIEEIKSNIGCQLEKDYVDFYDYQLLQDDERKRVLYSFIKNRIGYSPRIMSYVNILYQRLLGNKAFLEIRDNNAFVFDQKQLKIFDAKKFREYKYRIDEEGHYEFPLFNIDIKFGSFNIKNFPIFITPVKDGDLIHTNIMQNDAKNFIKKSKVPRYLRNVYPVIRNSDDQIIYIPYYEDILEDKLPIEFNLHDW